MLANDTQGRYVGPVDPSEFLEDYLPRSDSMPHTPCLHEDEREALRRVAAATSEKNIKRRCRDMPVPDFCLYEEAVETSGRMDFSTAELCIELKPCMSYDPFDDPDMKISKGQITTFAAAQFSSQFRLFVFSVVIVNDHARFVRWDRAGAIVTTRFNYLENLDVLTDFFWRFSHLSREERGHDPSVSPSNLSEEDAQKIRDVLHIEAGTALFTFAIPCNDGEKLFYGPHFAFPVRSLIGQSTRTIPVCDIVDGAPGKVVFLKEYWRQAAMRGEAEVYEHLIKHRVPHIAPLMCGGDVPRGETRTHEHAYQMDSRLISSKHLHRVVLEIVGRRICEFKSTRELTQAVVHAMRAHWKAYNDAKVLHSDITANNILIKDNGEGVLIGWELAIFLDGRTDSNIHMRRDHSVTQQFVSAVLLANPGQTHTLQDDIESFLHVLVWTILSYLPSPVDENCRKSWMLLLYDYTFKTTTGQEVGGTTKADKLALEDYPPKAFNPMEYSPIIELIRTLASPFRARYGEPPTDGEKEVYEYVNAGVREDKVNMASLVTHPVYGYQLGMDRLKNSEWFLNTIDDALKRPDWPNSDGAAYKLLVTTEGTLRQKKRGTQRVETDTQLLSVSSHPSGSLKRSNTTPPLLAPLEKRYRLDDNSDKSNLQQ
ncbi:hypothetical protein EDC04DRAFT_2904791 [Pisolithus marmoratus]|nr:hypothetical protein EDC04DRAFT_2904791 [Pisolithus marmoratus]